MAISLIYIKVSTRISFSFAFPTPTLQILLVFFTDESSQTPSWNQTLTGVMTSQLDLSIKAFTSNLLNYLHFIPG